MHRQADYNALMRAVLLLAFTALLFRLISTGQITSYIHPRFIWFTASGGIGLLLMAAGQLRRGLIGVRGFSPPMRTGLYLTITVVLCLGFLNQPHTFGSDLAARQGMNMTNRSESGVRPKAAESTAVTGGAAAVPQEAPAATKPSGAVPQPGSAAPQPGSAVAQPESAAPQPSSAVAQPGSAAPQPDGALSQPESAAPRPDRTAQTIEITSQNFVKWMTDIYADPTLYVGSRVTLEGFTFYPPGAAADEFAVTRLVVTCHVAHAYPDGILAYMERLQRPAQDTWHRAEGVLEAYTFNGTPVVRLRLDKLTPTTAPPDPYVYP